MEVRRSRHGKAAMVIGGNNIIKYLTSAAYCPVFAHAARNEFLSEYNKVLQVTVEAAALSFIKTAKHAEGIIKKLLTSYLEKF